MTSNDAAGPAPDAGPDAVPEPPPFDPAELEAEAAGMARAPLDTIVLPLLAPLARLLSADDPAEDPAEEARYQAALAALADDPTLRTAPALVGAMEGGDYVLVSAALLLDRWHLARLLGLEDIELPLPALTRAAKQWWQREQPPAPMAALVAAALMGRDARLLVERGSRPGRELARELFQYVRSKGATSWATAHELAHAWWAVQEHREQLLIRAWRGAWEAAYGAIERADEMTATAAAAAAAAEAIAAAEPPPSPSPGVDPATALELAAFEARCRELERSERALRLELEQSRAARSRAQERVEALEAELEPTRVARDRAERHARAMAHQLAEARATADAGDADPIEPPPDEGWPPDLLAGIPLVLFTGQARAAAREAMAEALRLAGAEVEVFDGHVKGAGPERFDPAVTVVCDVRFMGHSTSDRIRARAERSGARVLEVKNGQGGIVRAVAEGVGRMKRSR